MIGDPIAWALALASLAINIPLLAHTIRDRRARHRRRTDAEMGAGGSR